MRFERLLVFTVAAVAFACSTQPAPEPLDARSADRTIYISDKGLPGECYHDLGTLKFDEPFTDSVIDPDGTEMMKRLQSMAARQISELRGRCDQREIRGQQRWH